MPGDFREGRTRPRLGELMSHDAWAGRSGDLNRKGKVQVAVGLGMVVGGTASLFLGFPGGIVVSGVGGMVTAKGVSKILESHGL